MDGKESHSLRMNNRKMTGRIGKRIVLLTFRRGSSARILNKNNEKMLLLATYFPLYLFKGLVRLVLWFLSSSSVTSMKQSFRWEIYLYRDLCSLLIGSNAISINRVRSLICPRNLPYLIPVTNSISKETSSINRMFILKTMFKADFLHVVILY